MADTDKKPQWIEIGRSTTSPKENTERKVVQIDDYYVVVGFEVNEPEAFKNDTQNLAVDYGHAFFYVVKNGLVERVFSFGPAGRGKIGWDDKGQRYGAQNPDSKYNTGAILKDGRKNERPGTPDYKADEMISAFKVSLTLKQGVQLVKETDEMRQKITSGKQGYTAYMNDTCAETARDVLSDAGIQTPSGSGWVKHSGLIDMPVAHAVNPYMWHKNFLAAKKYEYQDKKMLPKNARSNPSQLVGTKDPLF